MKSKKILLTLLAVPLLLGCGSQGEVVSAIPEDYVPELPTFKDKNTGSILEDSTYAYFDFYETSDFHGAAVYDKDALELGIERFSTYMDKKREANPGGTFLISGGDMWQGTADSNISRGTLITYTMDVMDFDSMTLGNHEFDWTIDWIKNNKERSTFPYLCANLIDDSTGERADFVDASTIITRGDYKIGIVGTIGDNIKSSIIASAIEGYSFADEVTTVKAEAAALREDGCDIVVWSSHRDADDLAIDIGSEDMGVNLIFCGHSHTTLVRDNNGVPMIETKDLGRSIAHCQLALNKETKEVVVMDGYGCDENPTATEYEPDADVTLIYNQYLEKFINPVKNKKVGKAKGTFNANEELANFGVKAMYDSLKKDSTFDEYDIRATFTNVNGGVRADIASGNVTYGDVYSAFPFDNALVIMKTTGKKLQNYAAGSGLSNFAIYQNIGSYGELNSKDYYYYLTTDFLSTHSSYFKGDEVVCTTGLILRDCVADEFTSLKTANADDFKTVSGGPFDKIK